MSLDNYGLHQFKKCLYCSISQKKKGEKQLPVASLLTVEGSRKGLEH